MISFYLPVFSGLAIFTAWFGSFFLFLLALNHKKHLDPADNILRPVLLHWSLGLFLVVLIKIPIFLAALGVEIIVSELTLFYAVTSIFRMAAYFFFFRGIMILFSSKKLLLNTLPIIAFLAFALSILSSIFIFQVSLPDIGNMLRPIHYAVILFLIVSAIKILRDKPPLFLSKTSRVGWVFFIVGWVIFVFSDIGIALGYENFPSVFWFFNLVSSSGASLGFSLANVVITIAIILIAHRSHKKSKLIT